MTRFVDRHGNTVELACLDGVRVLIPRGPEGRILGASLGCVESHVTNPADLAARGIDLATLTEV